LASVAALTGGRSAVDSLADQLKQGWDT